MLRTKSFNSLLKQYVIQNLLKIRLFKGEIVLELTEIFKRKGDGKNEKKYKQDDNIDVFVYYCL